MDLKLELSKLLQGEVSNEEKVLLEHSRDTSLFEVKPQVVVFPKGSEDISRLVRFVHENKGREPELSITARAAGSDMTGGPLGESIILSLTRHFNHTDVDEENLSARVEPGVFYRNFEKKILPEHLSLPVYPASKDLAALGGMIMNNCAGERTLRYGQMSNFVMEMDAVLSDGNEYTLKKLSISELHAKKNQQNFEGEIYRKMHDLLERNYDVIKRAKPNVTKNSSGYALWDVYDREKGTFDLAQLFTGSQGTLGIMTRAKVRLMHEKKYHDLVAVFFKSWDELPKVVNALLPFDPESLETFDYETLKLGIRFMPEVAKKSGSSFFSFALKFLPEAWIGLKMMGLPKLIVLVEVAEESQEEVDRKIRGVVKALKPFKVWSRLIKEDKEEGKYWTMRRESFNLLRQHVKGKRTAPFIEDFCVPADDVPKFLPRALKILRDNNINVNIAGHAGNGNFHIIPLMDLTKESEREKIPLVAEKFYDLVGEFGGSISGEHNDGIIRTPFVEKMYGERVYNLFKEVKNIFDPKNIFNPGKKVGGSMEYLKSHIARQ